MYKKILLPYDFDNSFDNVPDQLVKLTKGRKDSMVIVVNVITEGELSKYKRDQNLRFDDVVKLKEKDIEPFKKKMREHNINFSTVYRSGNIMEQLLSEINDNDYDIVVMSNKRSRRDTKYVLGNVTHKVAKRVNTPVLIVK